MKRVPVYFNFPEASFSFPKRTKMKSTVVKLFKSEGKSLQRLDYIFCSDSYLLTMNRQWLKHDTYTDIITFDLSESKGKVIGEVYISIDRVRENASGFRVSFQDELRRVIFHGALHLCGYKDKGKAQQVEMRKLEDRWLSRFERST